MMNSITYSGFIVIKVTRCDKQIHLNQFQKLKKKSMTEKNQQKKPTEQ